jgi:hypothetical protein
VNKDLYGQQIQLPKEIMEYLETCFNYTTNSDSNTEGYNRNQELRDTGYVTYQQLGRIKNWFDNYSGDGKDAPYILNGADYMKSWVDNTLESMRNSDGMTKQVRQDYNPEPIDGNLIDDLGWLADMNRPSKEHSKFTDDVRITENLNRINEIIKKII